MTIIPPKPTFLDDRGYLADVEHVMGVLWIMHRNGGAINIKGESFVPKVSPDLYYMFYFHAN